MSVATTRNPQAARLKGIWARLPEGTMSESESLERMSNAEIAW